MITLFWLFLGEDYSMGTSHFMYNIRPIIILLIVILLFGCGGGSSGDGGGGGKTLSVEITSPTENVTINPGDSINFQANVSNGTAPYTYTWDFNGGATNSTVEDPGDILFSNPGTYNVILTVADNKGATRTSTQLIVTVLPALSVRITSPTGSVTIRPGEAVNFQSEVSNGTAPYTFSWNFDGGASNSTVEDPGSTIFTTPGTYIVKLTIKDNKDVTATSSRVITVPNYVSGIIDDDTVWSKDQSPFILADNIQVAYGATLTIEPGVVVWGVDPYDLSQSVGRILVFGNLYAEGTSINTIGLNVDIQGLNQPGSPSYDTDPYPVPFIIDIKHAEINSFFFLDGCGSFKLENSVITGGCLDLQGFTPTKDYYIKQNLFLHVIYMELRTGDKNKKSYIRNNVFYDISNIVIYNLLSSNMVMEYNSFLDIATHIYLYSSDTAELNAANNYWNTTDDAMINTIIYDKNDDLTLLSTIEYNPFLTSPHSSTPDPIPYLE